MAMVLAVRTNLFCRQKYLASCRHFAAAGDWDERGISLFIYPFFANAIVRKHYLRNGWVPV